jgi:hypothetical protein
MLKSFKSYIRESSDDEGQVLRYLLSSGLISKSEFYTLAKESGIPLHSGDFERRWTITLSISKPQHTTEETMDFLTREVSTIDQTYVANAMLIDRSRVKQCILEIASNLEEDALHYALDQLYLRHTNQRKLEKAS